MAERRQKRATQGNRKPPSDLAPLKFRKIFFIGGGVALWSLVGFWLLCVAIWGVCESYIW